MSESVLSFSRHDAVGVAHVTLAEIVHPDQLDQLSRAFRQHVTETHLAAYVLDLSQLTYLTSAAIGMLLNAHAHLKAEGRRFAVAARQEMVLETLAHPHLEKIFPVCASVDEAVQAVS